MKSYVTKMLIGLLAIVLGGCSSTGSILDNLVEDKYRSQVTITKEDVNFYSAKYLGSQTYCFPPVDRPVCSSINQKAEQYEPISELKIEEFDISFKGNDLEDYSKDMLYLVAADVAIQSGYGAFAVKAEQEHSICGTTYSTSTYGTVENKSYSQSTSINSNVTCSKLRSISILTFKNKNDVNAGVFYSSGNGVNIPTDIRPVLALYYGTTPDLNPSHFNSLRNENDGTYQKFSSYRTPKNAWKNLLDADGLSRDLRARYKITDTKPYPIVDKREKNKRNGESDLIMKNRISTQ